MGTINERRKNPPQLPHKITPENDRSTISNKDEKRKVYEVTKTRPLTANITKSRWKL